MNSGTPPNPAGGVAESDYYKYEIESPKEIAYILHAIGQKRELVTAYFNQGRDFVLTAILDVDGEEETVILDCGADAELNQKILSASKVLLVTAQDRVRVQFSVDRVSKTRFEGGDALQIALPEALFKFQRREYYRVPTPIAHPLMCQVALPNGGKGELPIVDISVGGIALMGRPQGIDMVVGTILHGCRIALPEIGNIVATLEVRNNVELTLRSGLKALRSGCMFTDLTAGMQVMIQRYIIRLDRDRRLKAKDE